MQAVTDLAPAMQSMMSWLLMLLETESALRLNLLIVSKYLFLRTKKAANWEKDQLF